MNFNQQQTEAIAKAVKWHQESNEQVFRLFGYAGTGKTTIARTIVEQLGVKVAYLAPTGKAVSVLRRKGCEDAMTIHRFAFQPVGENDDGEPIFLAMDNPNNGAAPDLIVLDEASMVGAREGQTLLDFGIPILSLGDPAQLPPVRAFEFFTNAEPDVMLDIIERTASPKLLQAAGMLRDGKTLPEREYEDIAIRSGKPRLEDLMEFIDDNSQILTCKNFARNSMNNRIREALGFTGKFPVIGDKIIATTNDYVLDVCNGSQWRVIGKMTSDESLKPYWVWIERGGSKPLRIKCGPRYKMLCQSLDEPERPPVNMIVNSDAFLEVP